MGGVVVHGWAVLLAAVSSMVVGSIWYAKGVFGATWQKLVKLDDKKMRARAPQALVIAFVSSLIMAYVLAHVIFLSHSFFGRTYLGDSLRTGLWMWVGFQGMRLLMHDAFEQRDQRLTLLNMGNDLVTIMVMAGIIGLIH